MGNPSRRVGRFALLGADGEQRRSELIARLCACVLIARNEEGPLLFVQTKTRIRAYPCSQLNKNQHGYPGFTAVVDVSWGTHS